MDGSRLIDKFQHQWEHVHVRSERSVAKIQTALNKLASIEHSSDRRIQALDNFLFNFKNLSKIHDQIDNIDKDIEQLEKCFVQIEDSLIVLRNHKEQQRELEERRRILEQAFEEEKSRYLEKVTKASNVIDN